MLKAKELINQSIEELEGTLEDLSRDIFELKNELKLARKLEKPHLLKEKRKDRAKILTVVNQKKSQGSQS